MLGDPQMVREASCLVKRPLEVTDYQGEEAGKFPFNTTAHVLILVGDGLWVNRRESHTSQGLLLTPNASGGGLCPDVVFQFTAVKSHYFS